MTITSGEWQYLFPKINVKEDAAKKIKRRYNETKLFIHKKCHCKVPFSVIQELRKRAQPLIGNDSRFIYGGKLELFNILKDLGIIPSEAAFNKKQYNLLHYWAKVAKNELRDTERTLAS